MSKTILNIGDVIVIDGVHYHLASIKDGSPQFEQTYVMGDKFRRVAGSFKGDLFVLAQVDNKKISLISLEDFNRWTEPVAVECPDRITEQEFDLICNGASKFRRERNDC